MAHEALLIQGQEQTVIVDQGEAYQLRKNGRRRHLGTYVGINYNATNTSQETATLSFHAWVNPQSPPLRRLLITMMRNSPYYSAEPAYTPPLQSLSIKGPVNSRMVSSLTKVA